MNRRTVLRTIGTGAAIAVIAPSTLLLQGCDTKALGFYVDTVTGALKQLSPLLPGAPGLISKAITIANDLNAAYKKGDFSSTTALFGSLSELIVQIADDAGVNSPTIKTILAIAGVALVTIANILKAQAPTAAVTAARASASPAAIKGGAAIDAAAAKTNSVFKIVKP